MRHQDSPKQTLVVIAHPSDAGYARQIAFAYAQDATKKGHEVKILDLYRDPYGLKFLSFQHVSEIKDLSQGNYFRSLLSWADEYVFCFPVWWYDAPAIFINFFETAFVSGYAYVNKGKFLRGLLSDKKVKIYATADQPAWMYKLRLLPFIDTWKTRLGLCGITRVKFNILPPHQSS